MDFLNKGLIIALAWTILSFSVALAGDPDDPRNLWPQPYEGACGARVKDKVEGKLKRLICAGNITLKEAQQAISTDWIAAYEKY